MLTDSPYGMTKGLNSGTTYLNPQIVSWIATTPGFSWFRIQIDASLIWKNQNDPPSAWSWNQLDDAVSQMQRAGLRSVYPIRNFGNWSRMNLGQKATTETGTTTPLAGTSLDGYYAYDPSTCAYYAEQVARRYNGTHDVISAPAGGNPINYGPLTIQSIEILNEDANIHPTTGGSGFSGVWNSAYPGLYGNGGTISNGQQPARDPHFYSPILKACAPAVRNNCNALVGMAAMWWVQPANPGGVPNTTVSNYTAFLSGMYADGCKGLFNYVNFHYYSGGVDPSVGSHQVSTFPQALSDISTVMNTNGDTKLPIWCTEFGWGIPADVPDEATQASRYSYVLTQAKTKAQADGREIKLFFFDLSADTGNSDVSSLVYWTGSAYAFRQAWTALTGFMTSNPNFIQTPIADLTLVGRDGQVTTTGRDGQVTLLGRG